MKFYGINSEWPITFEDSPKKEMVLLDAANQYDLEDAELKIILKNSDQTIIGATSSVPHDNFINRLWYKSIRGKMDFEYIRIPFAATPNKEMYEKMKLKLSDDEWLQDVELVHRI
jgi:hypothetical protein